MAKSKRMAQSKRMAKSKRMAQSKRMAKSKRQQVRRSTPRSSPIVTRSETMKEMEVKKLPAVVGIAGEIYKLSKPCFMSALGLAPMRCNNIPKYVPKKFTTVATQTSPQKLPPTSEEPMMQPMNVTIPFSHQENSQVKAEVSSPELVTLKRKANAKKALEMKPKKIKTDKPTSEEPMGSMPPVKPMEETNPSVNQNNHLIKVEISSPVLVTKASPDTLTIKKPTTKAIAKTTKLTKATDAKNTSSFAQSETDSILCSKEISKIEAILNEEIIVPLQKSVKNISGHLKDYNPNMARDLVSSQKQSGKENQSCRVSRAKATAHEAQLLTFCLRMKSYYSVLNDAISKYGGTSNSSEYYCELVTRINNNTYDPSEEEIKEQLSKRNPNMARAFHSSTDDDKKKNNNDAVIRCRAKKAIKKQKLQEAADMLKVIVDNLKDQFRVLRVIF